MRKQQQQEGGGRAALKDLLLTDHTDFIVLSSKSPNNGYLSWMECVPPSEIWGCEMTAELRLMLRLAARPGYAPDIRCLKPTENHHEMSPDRREKRKKKKIRKQKNLMSVKG